MPRTTKSGVEHDVNPATLYGYTLAATVMHATSRKLYSRVKHLLNSSIATFSIPSMSTEHVHINNVAPNNGLENRPTAGAFVRNPDEARTRA